MKDYFVLPFNMGLIGRAVSFVNGIFVVVGFVVAVFGISVGIGIIFSIIMLYM